MTLLFRKTAPGLIGRTPVRQALERFLSEHRSELRAIEIGAQPVQYERFFPDSVVMDVRRGPGVDVQCDVQALPFTAGSFSTVVCAEVLEHVREPAQAVAEMRRIVRPDGALLLTTRFVFPFHEEPHDFWRFTDHGLRRLLEENGWVVADLRPDVPDSATLMILAHHWLFARRGAIWKLPKLAWLPIWSAGTYLLAGARPARGRFPSGWHVLARPSRSHA